MLRHGEWYALFSASSQVPLLALQSLPSTSSWLRLDSLLFCLGEAVLKNLSSNDDFRGCEEEPLKRQLRC